MFDELGSFRPSSSGFGYWLGRCEGFRVDSPHGRVGLVEELSSSVEEPDAIAVRAGLFGRLLLIVPAGEVDEIFPMEECMHVRRSPRLTGTERVRELGRRLRPPGPYASEGSSEREGGEGHGRSHSRRNGSRRRPAAAAGAPGALETGRR